MGEYANVKKNKIKGLLKWLEKKPNISVIDGGKHTMIIKYVFWDRPYPIPFKHNEINKYIVKDLMKILVNSEICTKEEFDKRIK